MNVPELEEPAGQLTEAHAKIVKAAERWYAAVDAKYTKEAWPEEVDLEEAIEGLHAVRRKLGMYKHVFLWCELCRETHCEYCDQPDDMPGAEKECPYQLARFTK